MHVIIAPLTYSWYAQPLLPHEKVKGGSESVAMIVCIVGIDSIKEHHRRGVVLTADYSAICDALNALENDRAALDEYVQEKRELAAVITSVSPQIRIRISTKASGTACCSLRRLASGC